jgi:hypothetical protein
MSKGSGGKGGNDSGKGGGQGKGGSRAGSPGRRRAPNGFPGGNWPSTVHGGISSVNRGNAIPGK